MVPDYYENTIIVLNHRLHLHTKLSLFCWLAYKRSNYVLLVFSLVYYFEISRRFTSCGRKALSK